MDTHVEITSDEYTGTLEALFEGRQRDYLDVPWYPPIANALVRLLRLPPNWDSYGAEPVDESTVARVLLRLPQVMQAETPLPAVLPTNDGGVALEWRGGGLHFQMQFEPDEPDTFWYRTLPNRNLKQTVIDDDVDTVRSVIASFTAKIASEPN